ncbi:SRPBCC domain-containing protein [Streptomyces sp. NPDC046557]|uniref:SRPBCC domain-containing protein n=1 Tax=Streptomyces sp. NPDC046557 TaxID=3155372 RepID=UPI0033E13BBF
MTVIHGSFSVPADFTVAPAQVFRAFAEPSLRSRWFRLPGPSATAHHALDFRVTGGEVARNVFTTSGVEECLEYRSRFIDIVAGERIVLGYETYVNDCRRWISQVTVELVERTRDDVPGCRLTWTEQFAFLVVTGDGSQDIAHLRGSTRLLLNGLSTVVEPHRYPHLA